MRQDRMKLNSDYLRDLKPGYAKNNYPVPKWIQFCDIMLDNNWSVFLQRAETTVSKYIWVEQAGVKYKIRFSNHKPNRANEKNDDCNFYVGISHKQVLTTEQLLKQLLDKEILL